jgi:hypothetical protein
MSSPAILRLLFVVGTLSAGAAGQTPTFRVLVLDALDGKPQAEIKVDYFCEGQGWNPQDSVTTGPDGVAVVPYRCNGGRQEVSVIAPSPVKKEECGGLDATQWSDIVTTGVISDPSGAGSIWCPRKISRKLKPVPGQVTIFIKKPTWWQSHVAG